MPPARLTPDDVRAVVAEHCFPDRPVAAGPGRVGLEVERFPLLISGARLPIRGAPSSTAVLAGVFPPADADGVPSYAVPGGGRLTFEPGGAVEHATAPHTTAAGALDEADRVGALLSAAYAAHGAVLASAGVDLWNDVADVPLQLGGLRYPAMDAYFTARAGVDGPTMMRHTCSLQVNLDLGAPAQREERWSVANLLAPLLAATFAHSPAPGEVSRRGAIWRRLDVTRSGFPARFLAGDPDPVEQMTDAALAADVLLVRSPARGTARPGRPGFTFADWMAEGHPDTDDLRYHLSTLFHEVRPRGMLEFRSIDALPHAWRSVPVTLLVGALEDDEARGRIRDLLEPARAELPAWLDRAVTVGVSDPALCAMAVAAWSYALDGATRLPAAHLPPGAVGIAARFLDRHTLRGRCPADELAARLARDPAEALAWVAEPVPEPVAAP